MNDLYANEFCLFTNFFCLTLKLVSKSRDGSKWVRKHCKPVTPAQRLLDHLDIPPEQKLKLKIQMNSLNPFDLQKRIQGKLKAIFKTGSATFRLKLRFQIVTVTFYLEAMRWCR